jgi:hypothetical protein
VKIGDIVFEVFSRDFWIRNPWMKKEMLGIIVDEFFNGRMLFTVMWQDNTITQVYPEYLVGLNEGLTNEDR